MGEIVDFPKSNGGEAPGRGRAFVIEGAEDLVEILRAQDAMCGLLITIDAHGGAYDIIFGVHEDHRARLAIAMLEAAIERWKGR